MNNMSEKRPGKHSVVFLQVRNLTTHQFSEVNITVLEKRRC